MKRLYCIAMIFFLIQNTYAEHKFNLDFSFNKYSVGYQLALEKIPFKSKISLGVSNQDINSEFDDFYFDFQFSRNIIEFSHSNIYGSITPGIYFANNDYYDVNMFYWGFDIGYEYSFLENHIVYIESGYLSGKKDFIQNYNNEVISVSTRENLILLPFNFVIGYGFNF